MGRRLALLIGNSLYDDPTFSTLAKAKADARAMAKVLGDRNIGEFKVTLLLDEIVETMRQTIASFFQQGKKDDFLLLYFSGHGDAWNKSSYLHLIGRDTKTQFSVAQVVSSTFIKEAMDLCASKTQVLILDCCNSGAFVQGIKGKFQIDEETASLFAGSGHAVLTASSATQPAWEGDAATPLSLFTHYLVHGLITGEADEKKRGWVTLDEWYMYAYKGVMKETSGQQTPNRGGTQQGSIVIAKNPIASQQAPRSAFPGKFPEDSFVQPVTPVLVEGGETSSPSHPSHQAPAGSVQTFFPPPQRPSVQTIPTQPAPVTQPGQILLPPRVYPPTETTIPVWQEPRQRHGSNPAEREPKRLIPRRAVIGTMIVTGLAAAGVIGGRFVWDTFPHPIYTYRGHSDAVYAVAWSPDSQRIASGSLDNTIQVWDATTGRNVHTYRSSHKVFAVAWSLNGNFIASGGDSNAVQVWNAATSEHAYTYYTSANIGVEGLAWSPDSQRIVLGGDEGTVQIWDAVTGKDVHTFPGGSNDPVYAVAWSPNGNLIAVANGRNAELMVWDVSSSGHRNYPAEWVVTAAWSPDGKYIASGSLENTVQVWDALTGENVYTYRGHSNHVNAVAWSPNGKRIASGSGDLTNNDSVTDSTVQVWDALTGENVYTYRGHSNIVQTVAWSPDGKLIASGSWDKTVQVWSTGS